MRERGQESAVKSQFLRRQRHIKLIRHCVHLGNEPKLLLHGGKIYQQLGHEGQILYEVRHVFTRLLQSMGSVLRRGELS